MCANNLREEILRLLRRFMEPNYEILGGLRNQITNRFVHFTTPSPFFVPSVLLGHFLRPCHHVSHRLLPTPYVHPWILHVARKTGAECLCRLPNIGIRAPASRYLTKKNHLKCKKNPNHNIIPVLHSCFSALHEAWAQNKHFLDHFLAISYSEHCSTCEKTFIS